MKKALLAFALLLMSVGSYGQSDWPAVKQAIQNDVESYTPIIDSTCCEELQKDERFVKMYEAVIEAVDFRTQQLQCPGIDWAVTKPSVVCSKGYSCQWTFKDQAVNGYALCEFDPKAGTFSVFVEFLSGPCAADRCRTMTVGCQRCYMAVLRDEDTECIGF